MPFGFENASGSPMAMSKYDCAPQRAKSSLEPTATPKKVTAKTNPKAKYGGISKKEAARKEILMARKDALGQIRKAPRKASKSVKAQKKQWLQDLVDRDEELESSGEAIKNVKAKDGQEWAVEQILDSRHRQGKLEFLVLWEGFLLADSTWEPEEHLNKTKELIKDYFEEFPKNPGAPRVKPTGQWTKEDQ